MPFYLPKTKRTNTAITMICVAGIAGSACAAGWHDSAVSSELFSVKKAASNIYTDLEKSQALFGSKIDVVNLLNALANNHSANNWDGDGAKAIHPDSFILADLFIKALPEDLLSPEFAVESDGCILLDWTFSKSKMLNISVGANGVLAYAWLNNGDRGYATSNFNGLEIPDQILQIIQAVTGSGYA